MKKRTCGVYRILNTVTGKMYVGSSVDVKFRMNLHRGELRKNKHWNPKLQRSWNKHGEVVFDFGLLQECPPKDRLKTEQHFLDSLNAVDAGYNIARIAGDGSEEMHAAERRNGPTNKQREARRQNMIQNRKIREENQRRLKKEREETGVDKRPSKLLKRMHELGSRVGKTRKGKKPWNAGKNGLVVVGKETKKSCLKTL